MKKALKKSTQLLAGLVLASNGLMVAPASAQLSYNIGWASEYYFRGILQKQSSGSAGIDWNDASGFYAGAWTADVGDGLEVDGYFGYGIAMESGLSIGLGFTGYYYTGEFDDTYQEVNINLGYGSVALEYSIGQWDGFGAAQDYTFLGLTYSADNGFYGTYGSFGDEFNGNYIEIGWGTTISEINIGIAGIFSSDELSDQLDSAGQPTESEAVVFTIGKTF